MKLKSFGCSFVYGSELSSPLLSWPALLSQDIGRDYQCLAVPGCGNLQIMESVLLHASHTDFCVINWTWIDRFDFVNAADESWHTVRPALDHEHADYYYRHLHGQYRDMLTNLVYIHTAMDFLGAQKIPYIMTYMDSLLFATVQPEWHAPNAVTYLQQRVKSHLQDFDGQNFLDWSRRQAFAVSPSWHPLEEAHAAAAKLMLPAIDAILHRA